MLLSDGEVAQQLGTLTALLEDLGSSPSTHMAAHKLSITLVSGESYIFTQTYIQAKHLCT